MAREASSLLPPLPPPPSSPLLPFLLTASNLVALIDGNAPSRVLHSLLDWRALTLGVEVRAGGSAALPAMPCIPPLQLLHPHPSS